MFTITIAAIAAIDVPPLAPSLVGSSRIRSSPDGGGNGSAAAAVALASKSSTTFEGTPGMAFSSATGSTEVCVETPVTPAASSELAAAVSLEVEI